MLTKDSQKGCLNVEEVDELLVWYEERRNERDSGSTRTGKEETSKKAKKEKGRIKTFSSGERPSNMGQDLDINISGLTLPVSMTVNPYTESFDSPSFDTGFSGDSEQSTIQTPLDTDLELVNKQKKRKGDKYMSKEVNESTMLTEESLMSKYLQSRGIEPKSVTREKMLAISRSPEYKQWVSHQTLKNEGVLPKIDSFMSYVERKDIIAEQVELEECLEECFDTLEEMSETEDISDIMEEMENLDEISKATLQSYMKKRQKSLENIKARQQQIKANSAKVKGGLIAKRQAAEKASLKRQTQQHKIGGQRAEDRLRDYGKSYGKDDTFMNRVKRNVNKVKSGFEKAKSGFEKAKSKVGSFIGKLKQKVSAFKSSKPTEPPTEKREPTMGNPNPNTQRPEFGNRRNRSNNNSAVNESVRDTINEISAKLLKRAAKVADEDSEVADSLLLGPEGKKMSDKAHSSLSNFSSKRWKQAEKFSKKAAEKEKKNG